MISNDRRFGTLLKRFDIQKNLLSPKECSKLIKFFEERTSIRASVVNVEKSKDKIVPKLDTEVRDGQIVFCDHRELELNFVFHKLYYAALWANFGWSVFPLRFLQIAKYDANNDGGFYKSHRDIIQTTKPQRILSSVTQLSVKEDYTGCELVFKDAANAPNIEDYCNQGDTIFFTSIECHEVKPVLSGVRYSLTAWYEGPTIWNSESEYYV